MRKYTIERLLFKGGQAFIYQVATKSHQHHNRYHADDEASGDEMHSFGTASGSVTGESSFSSERSSEMSSELGAESQEVQTKMAMKRILVENISEANSALKELLLLTNLSHPNMISYTDLFIDESGGSEPDDEGNGGAPHLTSVCLIMKLYTNGDLDTFVRRHYERHSRLDEEFVLAFMRQLVDCVGYLHQKGVIHRDIKPLNVLVDLYTDEELNERGFTQNARRQTSSTTIEYNHNYSNIKMVLSDFGLSTNFSQKSLKSTFCGSLNYVSPSLMRGRYSSSVDIWALGCVMYFLLTGKERMMYMDMLQDREETLHEISQELAEKGYSNGIRELLFRMLEDDRNGNSSTASDLLGALDMIHRGEELGASDGMDQNVSQLATEPELPYNFNFAQQQQVVTPMMPQQKTAGLKAKSSNPTPTKQMKAITKNVKTLRKTDVPNVKAVKSVPTTKSSPRVETKRKEVKKRIFVKPDISILQKTSHAKTSMISEEGNGEAAAPVEIQAEQSSSGEVVAPAKKRARDYDPISPTPTSNDPAFDSSPSTASRATIPVGVLGGNPTRGDKDVKRKRSSGIVQGRVKGRR